MSLKKISLGLIWLLLLAACGSSSSTNNPGSPFPNAPTAPIPTSKLPGHSDIDLSKPALVNLENFIVFDRLVSSNQQSLLKLDLRRIERTSLDTGTDDDEALKQLLAVPDLKAETLSSWLKERVKVMISDQLSLYRIGAVAENEKRFYVFRRSAEDDPKEAGTLAAMYGMELYLNGKSLNQKEPTFKYYMIEVNNQWVHANTQRNGVMMIGPALFNPILQPNASNPQSYSNSATRIATLFHEARHADGNQDANSLGFGHAICPSGSNYEFKPACDVNANGPYSVSYRILKAYIEKCGSRCSPVERARLTTTMLDYLSRVVPPERTPLPVLDANPEAGFPKVDITSFQAVPIRPN